MVSLNLILVTTAVLGALLSMLQVKKLSLKEVRENECIHSFQRCFPSTLTLQALGVRWLMAQVQSCPLGVCRHRPLAKLRVESGFVLLQSHARDRHKGRNAVRVKKKVNRNNPSEAHRLDKKWSHQPEQQQRAHELCQHRQLQSNPAVVLSVGSKTPPHKMQGHIIAY